MHKSFSEFEYTAKNTRRDRSLAGIDKATVWEKLHKLIEPFYPNVSGADRPPTGLARQRALGAKGFDAGMSLKTPF